jgi:hypothetical protein
MAIPPLIGPIRSVVAGGWEDIPRIIAETEIQYWTSAASVPTQLAVASGASDIYDTETNFEI